ncbi:MAG: helix-turn-helix transcriptional regulator [Bacteroidia bacterium]
MKKKEKRETKKWEIEDYEFLKSLGENIIRIKKEKKLTSKEIYEELDIDKSNYRRIEAGKTNVSVLLLHRISKVIGVELKELIEIKRGKVGKE